MAVIGVKAFGGMRPFVQPRLLPETDSQLAIDVLLDSGAIRPMMGTTTLKSLTSANPRTIYRYYGESTAENQYWLEFPGDVNIARSPIVDDAFDRLYWTDGVQPRYAVNSQITAGSTLPGSSYFLGIPKPANTPAVAAGASSVVTTITREYVLTFYTASSESAPGDVVTVQTADGLQVKFTDLPTDNQGNAAITGKRLYRKVSGTYRRVASIPILDSIYTDAATDASLSAAATLPITVEVQAPTTGILAAAPAISTTAPGVLREYVYTRAGVNDGINYVAETPPSAVGSGVASATQQVTVAGFSAPGGASVAYYKLYRRDAGATQFRLVAQVPTGQTSYVDRLDSTTLGEPLAFDPSAAADSYKPTAAPGISVGGASSAGTVLKRAYLIIYEDGAGNLSAPGQVSNTVDAIDGVTEVALIHSETPPPGVVNKRIYRQNLTVSGASVTVNPANWKLLVTAGAGDQAVADKVLDSALGGALPSSNATRVGTPEYDVTAQATVPTNAVVESRSYVYTYVSAYGEEGPPSAPSVLVDARVGQSVTVSGMSVAPGGNYNITLKRIYRTVTGSAGLAEFQFVAEIPVATTSYADNVASSALGEILPSETWTPPPAGLKGMRVTANGFMVGFKDKSVYGSEPFLPHAWPAKNSNSVAARIVGIGVAQQSIYVLTDSFPYVVTGIDPSALSAEKLEIPQACVSKRSIVETGDGVLYASPDGIISLGSRMANLTETILNRKQWQEYNPSSIHAYFHERRYFAFYTKTSGTRGLLIFDFSGTAPVMTTCTLGASSEVLAAYHDALTDTLYLASAGTIQRLNASASPMTGRWRSKLWRLERPVAMAAANVRASAYPVTFRLYGDGLLRATISVLRDGPFRLPSGFMCQEWEFEVEGTAEVYAAQMASSVGELREV